MRLQKNLLLVPALISALLLTLLPGSIAQLRSAASAPQPVLRAKSVAGPRKKKAASPVAALISPPEIISPVVIDVRAPLKRLLDGVSMTARHRELSEQVLGILSPECQEKLETFHVMYKNPAHRGLAGRGVIILSGNVPDKEFIALLLHEGLGHFRDITCLTGTVASGRSAFRDGSDPIYNDDPSVSFYKISWENELTRKPSAKPADFVTGYPYASDNFEDLAEAVTYYLTQEENFRRRAAGNAALAAKLAWLEKYMPKPGTLVISGQPWDGKIPWDATKLAFTWSDY